MLPREEYIEQAYFFRSLGERMRQELPTQDLLDAIKEEILASTNLPKAIDYLASELRHVGIMSSAMAKLPHYFTPFQAFVIGESEEDRSRFDFNVAVQVLQREAEYRAEGPSPQGVFLFQFESLCRNRLGYYKGLTAMAGDPAFDDAWRSFILSTRARVGTIDLGDLIYVRSEHYLAQRARRGAPADPSLPPALFGEKEGQIALANRRRDPLLLFAALQRHLNYPLVPKAKPRNEAASVLPLLVRRVERLESRLKLLEDEQKGGIDLTQFYQRPKDAPGPEGGE